MANRTGLSGISKGKQASFLADNRRDSASPASPAQDSIQEIHTERVAQPESGKGLSSPPENGNARKQKKQFPTPEKGQNKGEKLTTLGPQHASQTRANPQLKDRQTPSYIEGNPSIPTTDLSQGRQTENHDVIDVQTGLKLQTAKTSDKPLSANLTAADLSLSADKTRLAQRSENRSQTERVIHKQTDKLPAMSSQSNTFMEPPARPSQQPAQQQSHQLENQQSLSTEILRQQDKEKLQSSVPIQESVPSKTKVQNPVQAFPYQPQQQISAEQSEHSIDVNIGRIDIEIIGNKEKVPAPQPLRARKSTRANTPVNLSRYHFKGDYHGFG